jgi:hypothetical protein
MSALKLSTFSSHLPAFDPRLDHKEGPQKSKYTQSTSALHQKKMRDLFSGRVSTCVRLTDGGYFFWTFPVSRFQEHLCKYIKASNQKAFINGESVLVGSCANHISADLPLSAAADYDFRVYVEQWDSFKIHRLMMLFFQKAFRSLSISHSTLHWSQSFTELSLTYTIGRIDCNFRSAILPLSSAVSVNASEGFEISLAARAIACMNQTNYCTTQKEFSDAIDDQINKNYPLSNIHLIRNLEFRVLYKQIQGFKITPKNYRAQVKDRILQHYSLGVAPSWKGSKEFSIAYQKYLRRHYFTEDRNLWAASLLDLFNLLNLLPRDVATTVYLATAWTLITPPVLALENPLTLLIEHPASFEHLCNLIYAAALAEKRYDPKQHAFTFQENEKVWLLHMQQGEHALSLKRLAKSIPDSWNTIQMTIALNANYPSSLQKLFFYLGLPFHFSIEFFSQTIHKYNQSLLKLDTPQIEIEKELPIQILTLPKQKKSLVERKMQQKAELFVKVHALLLKVQESQGQLPFQDCQVDSNRLQALCRKAVLSRTLRRREEDKFLTTLAQSHLNAARNGFPQALQGLSRLLAERVVLAGMRKTSVISGVWLDYADLLVHQSLERSLDYRCFSDHPINAIPIADQRLSSCWESALPFLMEYICRIALVEPKRLTTKNWAFLVQTYTHMLPQHYTARSPDLIYLVARYLCQTFLQTPRQTLDHSELFSSLLIQVTTLLKRTSALSRKLALRIQAELPGSTPELPRSVQLDYAKKSNAMAAYLFQQNRDREIADLVLAIQRELSPNVYPYFQAFIFRLSEKRHKKLNAALTSFTNLQLVLKGILESLPLLVIQQELLYKRVADLIVHLQAYPINLSFLSKVEKLIDKIGQFPRAPNFEWWNITCETFVLRMHLNSLESTEQLFPTLNQVMKQLLSFNLLAYTQFSIPKLFVINELLKKTSSSQLLKETENNGNESYIKDYHVNEFYAIAFGYFFLDALIRRKSSLVKQYAKNILIPLLDYLFKLSKLLLKDSTVEISNILLRSTCEAVLALETIDDLQTLLLPALFVTETKAKHHWKNSSKKISLGKIKQYLEKTSREQFVSNFTTYLNSSKREPLIKQKIIPFTPETFNIVKLYYNSAHKLEKQKPYGAEILLDLFEVFCQHTHALMQNKENRELLTFWLARLKDLMVALDVVVSTLPSFASRPKAIFERYIKIK